MPLLPTILLLACRNTAPIPDADASSTADTGTDATTTDGPSTATPECPTPRVVINEVQPSNLTDVTDSFDETPDWIELFNDDNVGANLAGWWVTDDGSVPRKWVFPSTSLAPGEHMLVFASGRDVGGGVVTWDTKVDVGHQWKYRAITAPVETGWQEPDYDDAAWLSGPSGFGRGDGDDNTEISAPMAQVRTTVSVSPEELGDVVSVLLHVDYDDGFVAWLNGVEVARRNLGVSGSEVVWGQFATTDREALLQQGQAPTAFAIDPALLQEENTLALVVVDVSLSSSDLSLIPFFTLGYGTQRSGRAAAELELTGTELHTNFQLRASGEALWLFDDADCLKDRIEPGPMAGDQSFGRTSDGGNQRGYFVEATPGEQNRTESRPGFTPAPTIEPPSGFYPSGVEVEITPGSKKSRLVVLQDGYEPTEADPTHAGSISLDGSAEVEVVRARAIEDDLWPSPVVTATYLSRSSGPLPVLSLVTDPTHLWDWDTGIYVLGDGAADPRPHYGANYWQDWERPLHAAMWEPDGTTGFHVNAGVEIHGGWTRAFAQKSLKVKMRSGYGDDAIAHEVFPGLGITTFDNLTIRNGGNDWHGCAPDGCSVGAHLRDGLMHSLTEGTDMDRLAFRPAEVYVNGEYWGVYNLRERPDRRYIASHYGVTDIDLLEKDDANIIEGDDEHFQTMLQYMRDNDLSDPAVYATVQTLMEVDQYANYMAFEIWCDNTDWPGNNTRYWRPRTPDGRWRWLFLDTDFGLGLYEASVQNNTLAMALAPDGPSWPNPPESTELFRLMVTSPEFLTDFLNRYADLMNTNLHPDRTRAKLNSMANTIAPRMGRQFDQWGTWTDGITTHQLLSGQWAQQITNIDGWLAERSTWAVQHLLAEFGLAGTYNLQLAADPPGSGTFELAAVEVEPPFSGDYFLGNPVTLTAVPAKGYSFAGWSDGSLPATPTITVDPATALQLTAQFE